MLSYWEQESFTRYDHIIAGSGIVGLSLSIELKERYPDARVLVLERGLLPTGASTRNAGFACMGSATELLDDLQHQPEEAVAHLFAARRAGLAKLRSRLGDDRIGYTEAGSHELLSEQQLPAMERLDYLNNLLRPITGTDAYRPAHHRLADMGFGAPYNKGLIENTCEGALNTGMMMYALMQLATSMGVEIKTGATITGWTEETNGVRVHVTDSHRGSEWPLWGQTLSLCTNAFTRNLLPGEDVIPGRGQVMITDPIPNLKLKGIYHFDRGYYYFREINGRVLFGGGRNIDFEGETTTQMSLSEHIQQDLEEKLRTIILPHTPYTISQRWAGIMAFGTTRQPIVKAISPRVFGAYRMGGMGVALGSTAAAQLAGLIRESI
jgi:glycine/D-amino acid oxidase-like deaminating enzyme